MALKIIKRLGIALVVLLVVYLIVYSVIYSMFSGMSTEKILMSEVSDSIMTRGIVLREESVINSSGGQHISYTATDGTKVNAGGVVAKTYSSQSATTNQAEREKISKDLESMRKLNANLRGLTVSLDVVESQIYSLVEDYSVQMIGCEYSKLQDTRRDLLYYINERKYLTGEQRNFDERIASLEDKMASFPDEEGQLTGTVTTEQSGVFTSTVDGYENCYDYANVTKITLDEFNKIKPAKVDSSAIGKLVTHVKWYVVCPISADEALTLSTTEEQIRLTFLTSATSAINAELVAVNQRDKKSDGVAVFKCDAMNEKLVNIRDEEVKIELSSFSGLRIPKKALRTKTAEVTETDSDGIETTQQKSVQGVYIKYVNELVFKEVVILYSSDNFVICDPSPDDDALMLDDGTVIQYDEVVTEGADLYDGKIVK